MVSYYSSIHLLAVNVPINDALNSLRSLYRILYVGTSIEDVYKNEDWLLNAAINRKEESLECFKGILEDDEIRQEIGDCLVSDEENKLRELSASLQEGKDDTKMGGIYGAMLEVLTHTHPTSLYGRIGVIVPEVTCWVGYTTDYDIKKGYGPRSLYEKFVDEGGIILSGPKILTDVILDVGSIDGEIQDVYFDNGVFYAPDVKKWYIQYTRCRRKSRLLIPLPDNYAWSNHLPDPFVGVLIEIDKERLLLKDMIKKFHAAETNGLKPFILYAFAGCDGSFSFPTITRGIEVRPYGLGKAFEFSFKVDDELLENIELLSLMYASLLEPKVLRRVYAEHREALSSNSEEKRFRDAFRDSLEIKVQALERALQHLDVSDS